MAILVDTNIFLRSIQPSHPMNAGALAALKTLGHGSEPLCIVPQIIIEFWTVCTRPVSSNGLGLTPQEARVEIEKILSTFQLYPESPAIFEEWKRLVVNYGVSGIESHDAKLVAAMITHGISRVLTFNEQDFRRYKEIGMITPSEAVGAG